MAGRIAAIRKALISRYHSVALTELPAAECSGSRAFSAPPLPRFPPQLASASHLHSTNITAYPVEPPPDAVPPPVNPPEGYNPPEKEIPDPVTLAEQWQYAVSLYSRFSSQAWAMAILTGLSVFGVGWLIKGTNPCILLQKKVLTISITTGRNKLHKLRSNMLLDGTLPFSL